MSLIDRWRIEREKIAGGTKLLQATIVQYLTLAAALATVNVVVLLQRLIQ